MDTTEKEEKYQQFTRLINDLEHHCLINGISLLVVSTDGVRASSILNGNKVDLGKAFSKEFNVRPAFRRDFGAVIDVAAAIEFPFNVALKKTGS